MKWFRLYHDIIDDPKIGLLSESEQLLWFRLLCLASMSEERGTIAMTDDEICFRLRLSIEFWRCTKEKFRCKGLIDFGQAGSIKITHWDEHQYESDSSASRVARHRAKKKKEVCNVTSPLPPLLPKRFSDGQDTDPDPDPDTDTDTDSDQQIDRVTSKNTAASFDAIAHVPQTIEVFVEPSEPVSDTPSPRTSTEQAHSVQPALSERASVPPAPKNSKKRKIKHIPEQAPEAFQMFWDTYYAFCLDVSCSAGARAAAVQEWDALLPTIERSDLEEGTAYYLQKKREQFLTKGEAIGISHCCRFLRDLKWQEALDHKRRGDIQPVMTPGNRRAMQTYQSFMTAIKDL